MVLQGLLLFLALGSLTQGFSPLITWSNREILDNLESPDGVEALTSLLTNSKEDVDVIVVFGFEELSFDDIAKYGSVFSKESDGHFESLKLSLRSAKSQYWTGVETKSSDWILDLAYSMGMKARMMDREDLTHSGNVNGLIYISMEDVELQDDVIGEIMNSIYDSGKSFVVIYTKQVVQKEPTRSRSRRSTESVSQSEPQPTQRASGDCPIGGVLTVNSTNTSEGVLVPCMLFCLEPDIQYTIDNSSCVLTNGTIDDYCCEEEECENGRFVTVAFGVQIQNDSSSCPSNVSLRFEFVMLEVNASSSPWRIDINVTDDTGTEGEILTRNHSKSLYVPFAISYGLGYACSAESYNVYVNNDTNIAVTLQGIQVQPFDVSSSSFAASDNCVGYFSEATWMGVVSVAILILILYIATICAFSINSLDTFEDPRGKTISVEKLH